MKRALCASGLVGLVALILGAGSVVAQNYPEVRRAQPADEPPVARALPVDQPPVPRARDSEAAPAEAESPDRRQLDYANALFLRKLYDLAVPEYEKYLDEYPAAAGRASVYFFLGECHRALNRPGAARKSFRKVLDDYDDSEFAGPAAYVLAETAFTEKDYAAALALFHRAAAKSKESAVALSARYFEARCLETLDRKDEACDIYLQVAEVKGPNPYREDARQTGAALALARGRKTDALRQYEALSNETQKPALKAEAMVRAGLLAVDLEQPEKGKIDKAMADKANALLQKARNLPEAGRFRAFCSKVFALSAMALSILPFSGCSRSTASKPARTIASAFSAGFCVSLESASYCLRASVLRPRASARAAPVCRASSR